MSRSDLGVPGLLCLVLAAAGCGGDEGSDGTVAGAKDPFGHPTTTTTYVFQIAKPNGKTQAQVAGYNGTTTVGGQAFDVFQVHPDEPDGMLHGVETYIHVTPGESIAFAGGKVYWADSGMQPEDQPFVSGTVDPPLEGSLNPPVGVPQTTAVKGTLYIGDPTDPNNAQPVDTTVTYTLVDDDASVETSMGVVHGCKYVQGETTVVGITVHPEVWYHPQMGVVKFHVDWPEPDGLGMDVAEIRDLGGATAGVGSIRASKVLSPTNRQFLLDTYDVHGQFDADKDQHAKMLLEMRWLDEDKARSSTDVPTFLYGNPEFGTVWGVFPSTLVASPVSLFHPEENGNGFTYYVAYVNQAAKNETTNGIAYHVGVDYPDYFADPLRVTARILYHLYTP